jgi:hypothetical protein
MSIFLNTSAMEEGVENESNLLELCNENDLANEICANFTGGTNGTSETDRHNPFYYFEVIHTLFSNSFVFIHFIHVIHVYVVPHRDV